MEFIGPATIANDGGVYHPALLGCHIPTCHFSYEALNEVGPDEILGELIL
jgi:hypothetical protein